MNQERAGLGVESFKGPENPISLNYKEYTLNHIRDPVNFFRVYSLIKGYWHWDLWRFSRSEGKGLGVTREGFDVYPESPRPLNSGI